MPASIAMTALTAAAAMVGPHITCTGRNVLHRARSSSARSHILLRDSFHFQVDLGEGAGSVEHMMQPLFSSSELIILRYPLPIELALQPSHGVMLVTRAGYGLSPGDVLRACSTFQMRLENDILGLFPAGTRPAKCFFLADGRPPRQVVEALTANTPDKTNEVVMVFERPT